MKRLMVGILSVSLVGAGFPAYSNQKGAGIQNGDACD
jgi:hypothetical protein